MQLRDGRRQSFSGRLSRALLPEPRELPRLRDRHEREVASPDRDLGISRFKTALETARVETIACVSQEGHDIEQVLVSIREELHGEHMLELRDREGEAARLGHLGHITWLDGVALERRDINDRTKTDINNEALSPLSSLCPPPRRGRIDTTVEFRADLVLELRDANGVLVLAIVLEVQRDKDPDKEDSWPVYVTVLRAKKRCPTVVLVVAPDADVATWAAQPIDLGLAGSSRGRAQG